jgi:hypothetical protein
MPLQQQKPERPVGMAMVVRQLREPAVHARDFHHRAPSLAARSDASHLARVPHARQMPSGLISPARLIATDPRRAPAARVFRRFLSEPTQRRISWYKRIELILVDRRQWASTYAHTSESSMRHQCYTYASLLDQKCALLP